jgi:uncharacterized membrane protein YvbJ
MRCPNCGSENVPGAAFCNACGKPVPPSPAQATAPAAPAPTAPVRVVVTDVEIPFMSMVSLLVTWALAAIPAAAIVAAVVFFLIAVAKNL